jgi:hypothetical protein
MHQRATHYRQVIRDAARATSDVAQEPAALLAQKHPTLLPLRWVDGDLLFGTSEDRRKFCQQSATTIDFQFGRAFIPTPTQQYPTLIDHYNDYVYGDALLIGNEILIELIAGYRGAQPLELLRARQTIADMDKATIAQTCVAGLRFFCMHQQLLRNTIHFIIGDDFFTNLDSVARAELLHIKRTYCEGRVAQCTKFYIVQNDRLVPVDPCQALWFDWSMENITGTIDAIGQIAYDYMRVYLEECVLRQVPVLGGMVLEHRLKSAASLLDNFTRRKRYVSNDIVAFRIVHPFTDALYKIVDVLEETFTVLSKRVSERGRVIHLLLEQDGEIVELQLWPSVLHSCFAAEHDTVYKARGTLTDAQVAKAAAVREKQHVVQDAIDALGLIIV